MPYQLLALDLDGTVLDHDLIILPEVQQAIRAAQARGTCVTLATGRMFSSTLPYADQLGIDAPLICYQGALIRHPRTGQTYAHAGMPGEAAAEAVRMLLAEGIFVVAYIDEQLWVAERRPELDTYLRWHPEEVEVVVAPDLAEVAAGAGRAPAPTKLLFMAEPAVVERTVARLGAHFAGRLTALRSHALFGELTALGISKGAALAALAAQMGVAREQVIAIGDQENDLPMLAWAGLGLAMGNAPASVRAAAAAVLPPVGEAGVAWAIRRYLLGE